MAVNQTQAELMRQILLHPGFHKTGASSIQHFLWHNRETLAPYFDLRMFRHFKTVSTTCAKYSATRDPLDLLELVSELDESFLLFPTNDKKDLLISCKGFCGHLPCNPTVPDYGAAPVLMTYLAGYLAERFPDAQVSVLFTTREPQDWLFSMYRQQLKSRRLTDDFKVFAEEYAGATALDRIIGEVAAALDPLPVLFMPLEEMQRHPLGPGAAVVDQMKVPVGVRQILHPVGRDGEGPDEAIWKLYLDLNRSAHPDAHVARQKEAIATAAGLGSWKPL